MRNFAAFVTDNTRIVAGTCWVIGYPVMQQPHIVFEPGDAREVDTLSGVSGHILLQDGTTYAGRLIARDAATLLLTTE